MRRFAIATFLMFLLPTWAFALVGFSSLLPNPAWDDTLWEYVEIRNTGCNDIDIAGYELRDLQRWYTFPSPSIISSKSNLHLTYQTSHIALNNSWLEVITLANTWGNVIDTFSYSGTQRDNVVLNISLTDEECNIPIEDIGSLDSWSWELWIPENTGSISTGWTTDSGIIMPWSDSDSWALSDTWVILDSSGSSGSTSSWEVFPDFINTWSTEYIESWALIPIEMYYSDRDGNNKIDTLEIIYPYILTGSISVENISLFSQSWGLSVAKIDTETGYILAWSLSGNILILLLREGDNEKTILRINNSTSSDLRLKSSWDLGFRSVGGQVPEAFFLTKSFDEYRKVYKKVVDNGELTVDNSGAIDNSGTGSNSGTGNNSWVLSGSMSTGILFPEIIPMIQSPTNATLSGEIFVCTTTDCRINITLEPIFSSGFAMRDYSCAFGTWEILTLDSDCNPNTIYFSHPGQLIIELVSKTSPSEKSQKTYEVEWKILSAWWGNTPLQDIWVPDTGKPVAIIELDNKWKEYYFQNGDNDLICYTLTCSVNFTAEKSYDPEGSVIKFLWIYGPNDISTSRDPGGRKYALGDHTIILRVINASGNYNQINYQIHVVWPKVKEEKIKAKKTEIKKKVTATLKIEKKMYKKIKMSFFSPPDVFLQWRTGEKKSEWEYICQAKTKNLCTINFSLTGTMRWYESAWIVDGQEVYRGKNPKSWKFSPWIHEVKILTYRTWSTLVSSENTFSVRVFAQVKKAKKKKIAVVKIKKQKLTLPKIIPEAHAEWGASENSSNIPSSGLLVFFSGTMLIWLMPKFRKKYFPKMSK